MKLFLLAINAGITFPVISVHVPQCRQRCRVSRNTWPAVWGLTSAFLQATARAAQPTEATDSSPMASSSLLVSSESFLIP